MTEYSVAERPPARGMVFVLGARLLAAECAVVTMTVSYHRAAYVALKAAQIV